MAQKPVIHGRDHLPGGADPIPGGAGGGIDFNKTNQLDKSGALASYLYLKMIGSAPVVGAFGSGEGYSLLIFDTGVGSQAIVNDGGGYIGLLNNGDGVTTSQAGSEDYGGYNNHGVDAAGDRLDGILLNNNGQGVTLIRNTAGLTVIDNNYSGIVLTSSGSDINDVAIKNLIKGNDFLVANDQTITRDPTTHAVTAITYDQARLRINDTDFFVYNLPTSNPGGSDKLWNNGGVVSIT